MQRPGDFRGHGNTATRQPQHERVLRPETQETLRQPSPRLVPIDEHRRHPPRPQWDVVALAS